MLYGAHPVQSSSGIVWPICILCMYSYDVRYNSLILSVKWQLKYTFCIHSMIQGYHECQYICDDPLVDGDLLCEQEMGNSHDPQAMAIKGWLTVPSCKLLNMYLRNIFQPICSIFKRLYRCVKIWMVKIWRIFGQSSISSNFSSTKISLHNNGISGMATT